MVEYLFAVLVTLVVLSAWVGVQHLARRFAARHPEFGSSREAAGCCAGCACHAGATCLKERKSSLHPETPSPLREGEARVPGWEEGENLLIWRNVLRTLSSAPRKETLFLDEHECKT